MKQVRGFTLIELMIALLIIGVIGSIAYPSYTDYVVRNNRTAVQQYMLELASMEQQYLLDSRTYTSTIANLGVTAPTAIDGHYTVAITVGTAPTRFTITATPVDGSLQADDGTLTLNSLGVKTPASKW